MAVLLFVAAFVSIWLILFFNESAKEGKKRVSFLKALMIQACLASLSTEAFSSIRGLDFNRIALFWTLISAINCYVVWSRYRSLIKLNLITQPFKQLDSFDKLCIVAVITIVFISLITCLVSPPTNYDSFTYHMTRVVRWIQNRSLEHTPTHNLRQIFFPPGASYLVTHLQLLARGDYFANCVQWVAYVGSIVGVSLITKLVVGDRAQSISALICATIPMAIMQSTTTQNDLVTSLWIVCLAYFVFQFQLSDRLSLFWIAIALGLAIVTKPTGIIFGIPLFILFAVLIVRQSLRDQQAFLTALLTSFKYCTIVGLGSLFFSLPSWARNLRAVNKLFGEDFATRNETHSLLGLVSNLLKNIALNLPFPGVREFVVFLHQHLIHIDPNDPRLNFDAMPFFDVTTAPVTLLIPSEDNVASPLHFILGILAFGSLIAVRKHRTRPQLLMLGLVVSTGYLLSCYLLKWQPWGNRLILPLFVLLCPIIAQFLTHFRLQKLKIHRFVLIVLSIVAIVYALTPIRHPLIALPTDQWTDYLGAHQSKSILSASRKELYYSGIAKTLKASHQNAVTTIANSDCRLIGFVSGWNDFEYPLWVLLSERTGGSFRMRHVQVKNESKKLTPEFPDSEVCAVLFSDGKVTFVK